MSAKSQAKRFALRVIERAPHFFSAWLKNPVFVIGYCRSGKSMLSQALSSHEKVCLYPSEANNLWHPELYPWAQSHHCETVDPLWWDPRGFVAASDHLRRRDWSKRLKNTLGAWRVLMRAESVINDSAMTWCMIEAIQQEFDNARFIHVVRDGRVASWVYARRQHEMNRRLSGLVSHACVEADFQVVLERCADYWAAQVEEMEELKKRGDVVPGENLHEVRYEDLCRDSAGCLDRVLGFLGLANSDLSRGLPDDLADRNEVELRAVEPSVLSELTARLGSSLAVYRYV